MYKKYSDADIIRVYSTMMDNSGNVSSDILKEIERRGGMEYFKRKLELRKKHPEELLRITNETQALTKIDSDFSFVRKLISSDILAQQDLDLFTKSVFEEQQAMLRDKQITSDTVSKGIAGFIIGAIVSGMIWWGLLKLMHSPFFYILPLLYILCYYIIRSLTKKSSKNVVVLILSFASFLVGVLIGSLFY